jgi:acetyl esterase/lipase
VTDNVVNDLTDQLDDMHVAVLEMLPQDLFELSDLPRARAGIDELFASMPAPELPADVNIEDINVPGLDGDPDVLLRLYRPGDLPAGAAGFYWMHGGGMVLGSVDLNDIDCAQYAADFKCVVASVDYRLAPEHPYPAPMNDCYTGLQWFAANGPALGFDPDRIAVGGASAGGGLAAGLAIMARDRGGPNISFQFLVFPMLDHRNETPSSQAITDTRVWNRGANLVGWAAYLDAADTVTPYASPAIAEDLSGLPPAYINVGTVDMFLDEDMAYAQALQRAGVPVELQLYPGAFHASSVLVTDSPLSQRWRADERAALTTALT